MATAAETAAAPGVGSVHGSTKTLLDRLMDDMESLGIVTELAGKVVGGVAMAAPYYQHVLATEGLTEDLPPCQVLITRRGPQQDLQLLPATQVELQEGLQHLPRESAVLSKMMSPAALSELHWLRVPAVVIFGCFVADEEELQEAASAGIPISPSLSGPHAEEQMTQMEVFFKQFKYPEHKCFILKDWGFMICGNDLPDAMCSFDERLKETLVLSAEAGDTMVEGASSELRHSQRSSATGSTGAGGGGSADGKPLTAVLSHAFKRLQESMGLLRTQSEPPPDLVLGGVGGGCGAGPKSPKADGSKPQFAGMSEPSSPMIGTDMLPESMRTISTAARRQSSEFRVPSIHGGLRPW